VTILVDFLSTVILMCQQVFFFYFFSSFFLLFLVDVHKGIIKIIENAHKANTDCTSERPTSHLVKCFVNKGKVFI